MSAIIVENLSKCYQIGRQVRHDTLRDAVMHTLGGLIPGRRPDRQAEAEDFWALRDVSFKVEPGEVVGIIGRNGAGKSTLLKILSRITEPTQGRIKIKGRVASLLEVGTGFHPELTGRDNIYLNGAILGMSRVEIRKKFDEIVAFAEVEKFLDTPVKRYSSGMYVRLAFAVAAHLEPEILIVDEVLAVGDAAFQQKCLGKMQDVARNEGRTVLFVSHNTNAIKNLCSRAIWMQCGTVVGVGESAAMLRAYSIRSLPSNGQSAIDLSARAEIADAAPIRFTRFGITATDNLDRQSFAVGQPFRMQFHLHANRSVTNFIVGFSINSPEGQVISCSNHYDSIQLHDVSPGNHTFVAEIEDLWLSPGDYTVTIAISQEGHSAPHDFIREVASFTIENFVDTSQPTPSRILDSRPGFIRRPMRWSHLLVR